MHRRISAASSSPSAGAAPVGVTTSAVRRVAPLSGAWSARSTFSPLAVLGWAETPSAHGGRSRRPRRQAPLRCSGLQGVAVGPLRPRRPFFSLTGRSGQLPAGLLYIAYSPRGATRIPPTCCVGNGIGVTTSDAWGSIELSKTTCRELLVAPIRVPSRGTPVGAQIRPQRTLPRNVAIACDVSVDPGQELPELDSDFQCLRALPVETWRGRALHVRSRAASRRGPRPSHHPATAAAASSRSAPRTSNHSPMAAIA